MNSGCHYKDIVSFNSVMLGPLFAEHACYMGPPGQVKTNYYFDNFAVIQKENVDEAILSRHLQEGREKNKTKKKNKSRIAIKSTLDRRQGDVNISTVR